MTPFDYAYLKQPFLTPVHAIHYCKKPIVVSDSWVSPTSYSGGAGWMNPTYFYDDDEESYALSDPSTSITLEHSAIQCSKVRVKVSFAVMDDQYLKVEVHKDGSWLTVFEGDTWADGWNEWSFAQGSVDSMRVTGWFWFWGVYFGASCFEADFWGH